MIFNTAFTVLACAFFSLFATSNADIRLNLHTGLQLGAETAVLLSPASSYYLKTFNETPVVSELSKVHRVLVTLTTLLQYQRRLNYSAVADSHQTTATNTVMQAVVEEACTWLSSLMEPETFNCTEADVASLMAIVEVYRDMLSAAHRFKRICRYCFQTMYVQWIQENVPCEGEGIIARNYMANPANEFSGLKNEDVDLTLLRCTTCS